MDNSLVECPFCGVFLEAGAEAETHVAVHIGGSQAQPEQQVPGHVSAAAAAPTSTEWTWRGEDHGTNDGVACRECGAVVPLADLDSHEEAHRLQALEGHRAVESAAEAQHFAALQQMYGFTDGDNVPRPGRCHLCGQEGHWRSSCPQNTQRISAMPRLPTEPSALVPRMSRETSALAEADVIPLLRSALLACMKPHTTAYLCSFAAHLNSGQMDAGWGCGYRNLQMLSSHLLARRPDIRDVLYGGCGWLPDIPSLQAWIEAAWSQGFDPPGQRQMGGGVQGTPKWIGSPEVAVTLRQFGIEARIVDFYGAAPAAPQGATIHTNVQCDLCNTIPIVGLRHASMVRPNYDLCDRCHHSPAAAAAAPYTTTGCAGISTAAPVSSAAGDMQRQQLPPAGAEGPSGGGGSGNSGGRPGSSGSGDGLTAGGDSEGEGAPGARAPAGASWGPRSSSSSGSGGRGRGRGRGAAAAGPERHPALVQWIWEHFSRAPALGGSGPGNGSSSSAAAAAAASGSSTPNALSLLRSSPVTITTRGPLYLQHEGHSRTVVGIERVKPQGGAAVYRLLILDPSDDAARVRRDLDTATQWQRRIKRGVATLRHPEFQVVYVSEGSELAPRGSPAWEALKTIKAHDRVFS